MLGFSQLFSWQKFYIPLKDVTVADRNFIHELFDWRITDQSSNPKFLFFDEIEKLSASIYERLLQQ